MQSVHILLKLAQLRLPECLMKVFKENQSSVENYKLENDPMVVRRNDTRTHSKPPLKTSTYQEEQIVQDRTKWRGRIRKRAGEYEAK